MVMIVVIMVIMVMVARQVNMISVSIHHNFVWTIIVIVVSLVKAVCRSNRELNEVNSLFHGFLHSNQYPSPVICVFVAYLSFLLILVRAAMLHGIMLCSILSCGFTQLVRQGDDRLLGKALGNLLVRVASLQSHRTRCQWCIGDRSDSTESCKNSETGRDNDHDN